MVSHEQALHIKQNLDGFCDWASTKSDAGGLRPVDSCETGCKTAWAQQLQGLSDHIEHYKNSSVMHKDVPKQFRPLLFEHGEKVPFPAPSKKIKPPRSIKPYR